jgi:hypothetical protein
MPFTITSKTTRYLRIHLPKETKELFNENYKPLKREKSKKTSEDGKTFHARGLVESTL